jgi:hypothetical protein
MSVSVERDPSRDSRAVIQNNSIAASNFRVVGHVLVATPFRW